MKKIIRYLLLLILMIVVVRVYVYFLTKTNYQDMNNYEITVQTPEIVVTESKAAKNKGYIKGNITNNSSEMIKNLKVKFEFYNENEKLVGIEYRNEDVLNASETIKFDIEYNYKNVEKIKMSTVTEE